MATTKRTRSTSTRRLPIVTHRKGTAAAKAHQFIQDHPKLATGEKAKEIRKRFKLTEATSRNWASSMSKTKFELRA